MPYCVISQLPVLEETGVAGKKPLPNPKSLATVSQAQAGIRTKRWEWWCETVSSQCQCLRSHGRLCRPPILEWSPLVFSASKFFTKATFAFILSCPLWVGKICGGKSTVHGGGSLSTLEKTPPEHKSLTTFLHDPSQIQTWPVVRGSMQSIAMR